MTAAEVIRQEAFEDLELKVIEQNGEEWFSAEDIGKALGMAEPRKFVLQIFNRNREEFEGLYRVLNLKTWLKSGLKLPYRFTTFNPQGAYLLAILARTPKSKALRRWLAKFMAHDLETLRAHVAALEGHALEDQARIKSLTSRLGAATRELKRAKEKLTGQPAPLKALPGPESGEPLPPYECREEDLVWVNTGDLKRLVSLACQVNQDYENPWFQRVIEANSRLDKKLELVLHGYLALRQLLELPLPPVGIRRILEEHEKYLAQKSPAPPLS